MGASSPLIRVLTSAEIETLVDWAAAEGWNPGLADAEAFRVADPQGFLGCFVDGGMAAGIAAVSYGAGFGFIGLYICRPDMRGKGYGRRVWDAGLAHLEGRTVALDGVPEQQENYRSMGFLPVYRTWRWSGRFRPAAVAGDAIRPVTPALLPALAAYDRAFFPAPREDFLRRWTDAPRHTLALVEASAVRGYGTVRRCRDGFKIGPLFADREADAETLFSALSAYAEGETVHIDVPETNAGFARFLEKAGFTRGFVTARMVRGAPPAPPRAVPAGITTLELG